MIEEVAGPKILFIEDVLSDIQPIIDTLNRKELSNTFIDARPDIPKPSEPIKSAEIVFLDLHFSAETMAQFDAAICAGLIEKSVPPNKQYYLVIFSRDTYKADEVLNILMQIDLMPVKAIIKQKNHYDFHKESEVERLLNEIDDEFERIQQIDEVYAEIISVEDDQVIIECLIDENEKIFQTRYLSLLPFSNWELQEGKYLLIRTITKLGSITFEFHSISQNLQNSFTKDTLFNNIDPNDLIG